MDGFEVIRLDDVPRLRPRPRGGRAQARPSPPGDLGLRRQREDRDEAGQALVLPHDERENGPLGTDGHEELYVVLRGRAVFTIGGDEVDAGAGTLVFVRGPALVRSAVAREAGTAIIGVGAPAGRAFRPAPWEARAIDPDATG